MLHARIPIGVELAHQLVDRSELLLGAKAFQKMNLQFPSVDHFAEIKQMNFDRARTRRLECRAITDIHHAVQRDAAEVGGNEVNSVGWNELVLKLRLNVRRRKPDAGAPSVAFDDRAGQRVRPAEALFGASDLALKKQFPDARAGHDAPPDRNRIDDPGFEAEFPPKRPNFSNSRLAIMPEHMVVSDDDFPHSDAPYQILHVELLGRK